MLHNSDEASQSGFFTLRSRLEDAGSCFVSAPLFSDQIGDFFSLCIFVCVCERLDPNT